ncbi:hypothetical protein E8E12_001251 [Didymella heteroderae]|uniref:Mid2 domain-containing protein n=1 Tax=Didymella heteroderae TaxID=1769908 RepID=A0A9P5BVR7_9PLEO|nr:hypothetical protein E8E12_001251 [Didymella heteroderae]
MTAVDAGGHSTCCPVGDLCLTNGMCRHKGDKDSKNWFWRTACTDKTWQDPACPRYCEAIEPTRNTGLLFKCLESESYCCAYVGGSLRDWPKQADTNLTCCTIDDLTFKAPDPVVYATASFSNRVSTQSTSTYSTSTYLSTISQDLTATRADITSSPTGDDAWLGGNAQQQSTTSGLSTGAKIGIGVGIPLGVIGLAAIAALFWLRRRRQARASKNSSELYVPTSSNKGNAPPYHETAMNHQGAAVYRQEAPSPQLAAELPAAVEPTELPPQGKNVT